MVCKSFLIRMIGTFVYGHLLELAKVERETFIDQRLNLVWISQMGIWNCPPVRSMARNSFEYSIVLITSPMTWEN